jgi:Type II CAAX prenyl endopeptidase Rce1-like
MEPEADLSRRPTLRDAPAAVEVLGVYAGILLYIWQWQYSHPYLWIPLLAIVLLSQVLRHETPRAMGLTGSQFRHSMTLVFPLLVAVVIAAGVYSFWAQDRLLVLFHPRAWLSFTGYLAWCSFQQYLTQSYFHRRLMSVMRKPRLRSLAIAIMFGGAHIPNPILMVATFVGGFVFAEIFFRHPNIWPLAFLQAVAGFLMGVLSPPALIHNMRVGPGYFFYVKH